MAKKDKKNKKVQDDDWENEIGESIPPANAAPAAAEEPAAAPADDEMMGGGLLGAIRKNRDKKGKKGKKQQDTSWEDELGEQAPTKDDATPTTEDPEKPKEVTEIDEDDFAPKKGKKGGNNKKVESPAQTATPANEPAEEVGEIRVKSKKEKEKEKKEREKQRKKEQAARKKADPAAQAAQEKKDADAAKAAATAAAAEPAKPAASAAAGKKKKVPAALAALQRQQELLRQQEEERRRLEEEEARRIAEEETRLAEEEAKREEAKARKKEKEREKKEQLKKEGKYMTKKQKEEAARAKLRLEQMKAAGMIVAGLDGEPSTAAPKKKDDRKKGPSKKAQEEAARKAAEEKKKKEEEERMAAVKREREEAERKKKEEAEKAAVAPAEDDDVLDDWEKALESEEDVKESWDQDSDDEEEEEKKPAAKAAATPAPAPSTKTISVGKEAPNGKKQPARKEESSDEESDSDDDSDDDSDSEDEETSTRKKMEAQRKAEAAERRAKALADAKAAASKDNLRSPICCILGHVDTGKTKLLDKIRQTNVQEGEAGGITQQIGATYFPVEAIKQKTRVVDPKNEMEFKAPGLLIIDTPGHESFTNLRSRGSSLCNIAILVVDIMHGLEPQTLESIRLLRDRKTPFIVALNKIDRLYGWNPVPNNGFRDSLSKQKKSVQNEFKDRLQKTILAFSEQGLNSTLFDENRNVAKYVSLVPTSAHTGEGIPDMLKLLVELTQTRMSSQLMFLSSLECTVLEVKVVEGLGTTIDVILSNGVLREGDRIVLCGLNGPIATNVRALLTPQPLKELRVKSQYVHNKEIKAAMGIKIAANDLESAIAGSRMLVVGPDDDEEDLMDEVMGDLEDLLSKVSTTGRGVAVQASTLGSLEALLEFLRVSKIPVSSISIGPVFKRDVMRAGAMLEKSKEYAVMLCFDVRVDKEAQEYADQVGVKIFTADIIYHLFDNFTAYQKEMLEEQRREAAANAVWPCVIKPVAVFMKKDPIVLGVDVEEGVLKIGTPLCAFKKNAETGLVEPLVLGRVTSIELNHKAMKTAKKGTPSVAIKIEGPNQPLYGRHLDEKDVLYSHISRKTIDTLKKFYRDEVTKEEWQLIVALKKRFDIS